MLLVARAGRRVVQPMLRERILQARHAQRAGGAVPVAVAVAVAAFEVAFALALALAVVDGGAGGNGCARASTPAGGAVVWLRVRK